MNLANLATRQFEDSQAMALTAIPHRLTNCEAISHEKAQQIVDCAVSLCFGQVTRNQVRVNECVDELTSLLIDVRGDQAKQVTAVITSCVQDTSQLRSGESESAIASPRSFPTPRVLLTEVRAAARMLRGYPRLFEGAYWWVSENKLLWSKSRQQGGYFTEFGVTPENGDLPRDFIGQATRAAPEVVCAYRVQQTCHDIRWLASAIFPNHARSAFPCRPGASHSELNWLLLVYWRDLERAILELDNARRQKRHAQHWLQGQAEGAKHLNDYNRKKSERAGIWREAAIKKANAMLLKDPSRPLATIAQSIAGELSLEMGFVPPLRPKAVYDFLRRSTASEDSPYLHLFSTTSLGRTRRG